MYKDWTAECLVLPFIGQHGSKAAALAVAEQYVQAFGNLAKKSNTIILPEKAGDVSSMVAQASPFTHRAQHSCHLTAFAFWWLVQAMAIYGHMINRPGPDDPTSPGSGDDGDSSGSDRASFQGLEKSLAELNKSIEDSIGQKSQFEVTPSHSPAVHSEAHFTLADSPTYKP